MVAAGEREPRAVPADERQALAELARVLDQDIGLLRLTAGHPSRTFELPDAARALLRDIVYTLAQGRAVTLSSVGEVLTVEEAANILSVSRPYLIKLLEQGEIPSERAGTQRRMRLNDLLAYKRERDRERRQGLLRLVEISEELGLYDLPIEPGDLLDDADDEGEDGDGPGTPPADPAAR